MNRELKNKIIEAFKVDVDDAMALIRSISGITSDWNAPIRDIPHKLYEHENYIIEIVEAAVRSEYPSQP